MPRTEIRPFAYGRHDLALIKKLDEQFFAASSYEPYSLRQLLDLFGPLTFIAEAGQQAVGYIIGGVSSERPAKGWILSLVVIDQDSVTGRLLVERLIAELRERALSPDLHFTRYEPSPLLEQISADFGFRPVEKIADYFEPGSQRTLMRLVF